MKYGFETLTGTLVIAGACVFLYSAYDKGHIAGASASGGYKVYATFGDIGSLGAGADVRISGVKVGYVETLALDKTTYRAKLSMRLNNAYSLPDDSSAAIISDGLLGGKYVQLVAGGSEEYLTDGSSVSYTQDAVSLEQLIGKFAFGGDNSSDDNEEDSPF